MRNFYNALMLAYAEFKRIRRKQKRTISIEDYARKHGIDK